MFIGLNLGVLFVLVLIYVVLLNILFLILMFVGFLGVILGGVIVLMIGWSRCDGFNLMCIILVGVVVSVMLIVLS